MEDGIAIRKKIFGEGAERIVYQLAKIQRSNQGFYIARNIKLVAKESKFVINDENEKLKFHEVFCKTQSQSGDLANKFNQMLHKHRHLPNFALVKFLDCAVYVMNNDSENRNECWGILVEKMLNPDLYKKWNDNQGTVDGINKEHRVNFLELFESLEVEAPEMPIKKTRVQFCDVIAEEEDSEDEKGELIVNPKQQSSLKNEVVLTYDDFPQAFSHYTYFYSNRKKLVCDLQGVLDKSQNPPVFELTDPVIHYASSKGRKKVFGRTDRGKYGIMDFFKTHKCNAVCLLLGLPSDFKK